ncbi:helix-turn-helix transcriptional regulator [uncultured Sphaerochaeta sp.]|uniref:helix-turn-helix domain-containing protein n=1 Tax=uncultured Sphaerochaeta sp. TaxID=886478 RepID=UPI002A0A7199|nr:helix-turn-helix transcriptional regulator [uncultured Sphaerochaeta sp.]
MAVDMKIIGERLKVSRERIGLTQKHIAEYLNVDQSLVSKFESGERVISSDMLDALSALFCCSISALISNNDCIKPIEFAFRTTALDKEDLEALAIINKIALNQVQMEKLSKGVKA